MSWLNSNFKVLQMMQYSEVLQEQTVVKASVWTQVQCPDTDLEAPSACYFETFKNG